MTRDANDRINVGVVGLGGRGLHFCNLYSQHAEARLHSVCDLQPARIEKARARFGGGISAFTNVEEMCADPALDAVIVATYDHQHTEPTIQALDAGKHTLVEKPLAQTIEDCRAMIEAARRSTGVFMVGLELRHCVLFERMKELLDDGAIGDVKVGIGLDNVSVGGNYFYHGRTRYKDFIKSLLVQKACHSLDLLNWFMGGRPTRVFALGGLDYYGRTAPADRRCRDCGRRECPFFVDYHRFVMDYGAEVELPDLCVWGEDATTLDNSELVIQYDNGTKATFTECHFTPEYSREFTLIGAEGKMYGHYNNEGHFVIRIDHRFSDRIDEYRPVHPGGGHGGGDPRLLDEFVRCCRGENVDPRSGVLAAYDSTVLGICAEQSIDAGQPIDIPLI